MSKCGKWDNIVAWCEMQWSYRKHLGIGRATAAIVGNIVGAGIFLAPQVVTKVSHQVPVYLALWIAGGVLSGLGALVYAELAVRFPRAGGDLVYLREAFGPSVALAWGWFAFVFAFAGSLAALAAGVADTLAQGGLLSGDGLWLRSCAGLVVVLVTLWNSYRPQMASLVQVPLSLVPVGLLVLTAVVGLVVTSETTALSLGLVETTSPSGKASGITALPAAMAAVYFSFTGWNCLSYVAPEVRSTPRTLPAAVLIGLGGVTALYLLLNTLYVNLVPLAAFEHVRNFGVLAFATMFGRQAGKVFAAVHALTMLATANVTAMAGSRVAASMAHETGLWPALGRLNRHGSPYVAVLATSLVSLLLVLSSSFTLLLTLSGRAMMLLSCFTVATLFVFRRRKPHAGFLSPCYPVPPLLFIGAVALIAVVGLLADPVGSGLSTVLFLLAFVIVARLLAWRKVSHR